MESLSHGEFEKVLEDFITKLQQNPGSSTEGTNTEESNESGEQLEQAMNSLKDLEFSEEALEKLVADFEVIISKSIIINIIVSPLIIIIIIIEQSRDGESYGRNDEQTNIQRCIISTNERDER